MSETVRFPKAKPIPASVADLVQNFSVEATPDQIMKVRRLEHRLAPGTRVYVPCLATTQPEDVARACAHLSAARMRPVPHLAARALASRAALASSLGRFRDAGAEALLLVGGDIPEPAGPFGSALDVLETGLLADYEFHQIGFAGYPDGHPLISESDLFETLAAKAVYARESGAYVWLTSQFTFSATPITDWVNKLAERGIDLPVRVGVPGPAKLQSLLGFAMKMGAATSAQVIDRQRNIVRMPVNQWTPYTLLADLARHRRSCAHSRLVGVHVYTFGGFAHAVQWMQNFDERVEDQAG